MVVYRGQEKIEKLRMVLKEIGERYWFEMDEIGTDGDHVHVFVGAAPRYGAAVCPPGSGTSCGACRRDLRTARGHKFDAASQRRRS